MFGMGTGVAPPVMPPGTLFREASFVKRKEICLLFTLHEIRFTFHDARPRALQTMSIRSKDDDVKPHDRLVLVSYSPYGPSTPSLSNS